MYYLPTVQLHGALASENLNLLPRSRIVNSFKSVTQYKIQEFPEGALNYYLTNFPRKLHENEKNPSAQGRTPGGGGVLISSPSHNTSTDAMSFLGEYPNPRPGGGGDGAPVGSPVPGGVYPWPSQHPATTSQFISWKRPFLIDINVKNILLQRVPLTTNIFFCIKLLVLSGTQYATKINLTKFFVQGTRVLFV